MKRLWIELIDNLNAVVFTLGCAMTYHGLAQWSHAAADLFAGLLGMMIGAWPYLLRLTRKP